MKMFLLRYSAAALCFVFALGAVSGEEVKAVGDAVSFRTATPIPPGASIIWKHISASGDVTKAIEYDEDGVNIYNDNFKGITSLDEKTGEITIKKLKFSHTGVYTIDINSKEQTQRFSLTVKERVPKPTITIEKSADSKAAYLTCKYDESVTMELSIIWKNSTGEIKTFTSNERSQSITVHSTGNPKNYYTCTLDNIASRATSDPVTEEQLFKVKPSSGSGLTISLVLLFIVVLIVAIVAALYKWKRDAVDALVGRLRGQQNPDAPSSKGGDGPEAETHPLNEGSKSEGQQNPDATSSNGGDGRVAEVLDNQKELVKNPPV